VAFRTLHSNFTAGELAPAVWARADLPKYAQGAKELRNLLVRPQGGVTSRPGTQYVAEIPGPLDVPFQLMPFTIAASESYVLCWGDERLFIVRDGGLVAQASTSRTVTVSTVNGYAKCSLTSHGFAANALVFVDQTSDLGLDRCLFRVELDGSNAFWLRTVPGNVRALRGDLPNTTARVTAIYSVTSPYPASALPVFLARDQATGYILHRDYAVRRLRRQAVDNWTLTTETFGPSISPPTNVTATREQNNGSRTYRYVVSAVDNATGEESLPSAEATVQNAGTGYKNRISWDAVSGAGRYIVYKFDNGVFGYIGGTDGTSFVDDEITPDTSDTPQKLLNPFNGDNNYPAYGTFFEQRLVLAGTRAAVGGVWMSQTASPRNFNVSQPLKASDAISFRVRANEITELTGVIPMDKLVLLTASGAWTVRGGDQQEYLTPRNVVLRPLLTRGAAEVPPLLIGDVVLYATRGGRELRDLSLTRDVTSIDLTILARHLFDGRSIRAMAYQQSPFSVVWVVFDDGKVAAMTFMPEHQIWAWSSIEFGGTDVFVESVAAVPEARGDAVYFLLRRRVNGIMRRYIERLIDLWPTVTVPADASYERDRYAYADLASFLDCSRRYVLIDPTGSIDGLHHLEGERVAVVADGEVFTDLAVINGTIELPISARVIDVGYPFMRRLRTLDLDLGSVADVGTVLNRHKTAVDVHVLVEASRGFRLGYEAPTRVQWAGQPSLAPSGDPMLYSGYVRLTPWWDWVPGGNLIIEQPEPLPLTIGAILVDWEIAA
jgi:hypothetical protein